MNIHKILGIIVTAIVMSLLVFAGFIVFSFKNYQQSLQKAEISQNMSQMIFERRFLAEEYVSTQSERAKSQWFTKQASLKDILAVHRPLFQTPADKAGFMAIENSVDSSQIIFNQTIQWHESSPVTTNSALLIEAKNRLSSQLSVKAQEGVSAATDLANQNNHIVTIHFQQMIVSFAIAGTLLTIILSGSFAIVWRSTSELYKQKVQTAAILNGIGDGVFVIDRSWNILLFNKAAADISGWSQTEVIGKPLQSILKLISQKNRQDSLDFIEKAMVSGKIQFMSSNTLLVRKDGTEIPIGDSAAPFIDGNGKTIGVIVIFRDLTQEKAATALKSDFAYASHQLRTPVTKALWGLEAAMGSTDASQITGKATENLRLAYLAIKSVKKLTDSIQEVSRVDQGLVMPKQEKIQVLDLIHQVIKEQIELTGLPSETFVINSAPDIQEITTTPKLLSRIFSEIINNAIVYSSTQKPIIIQISQQTEGTLIEITDQGIGIVEAEQPTVFTKFFRGSNFNTTEIAGTGLGLYLCREYAKLLGAKMWFDSTQSKGTTFSVFLPKIDSTLLN